MNKVLLEEIVRHVFSNFAVIPSHYVNLDKSKSLARQEYLLQDKLSFELDNQVIRRNIWGCQISADPQEFKVLLGDCSQEKGVLEFAMIAQLKGAPFYGLYLALGELIQPEPMLACSLNGKDWMECNTYLQATFLAGMEQVRDLGLSWNKCANYTEQHEALLSFIRYHAMVYEVSDEGKEEGF